MKYLMGILIVSLAFSCKETPEEDVIIDDTTIETEAFSEAYLIRYVEGQLKIPATEKYTYKIYKEELNGDDSVDIIITVNQVQKAIDKAVESGKVAKLAELGYMGNYNHFFFVDGETKKISPAIPVPSSAKKDLEVSFENIRSDSYKDIQVDFRIRNSCFRRFFTISDGIPRQTFESKIYDGLGDATTEAFVIKFETGSYSMAKDIVIYKGSLEKVTITDPEDVYQIDPKIEPTDEMERLWFFNDRDLKYYTSKEQ